jgi:hypothetical protein
LKPRSCRRMAGASRSTSRTSLDSMFDSRAGRSF